MDTELNEISSNGSVLEARTQDERPLLSSDSNRPDLSFEELETKCAAFARHDVYGSMGRGSLPVAEYFLCAIGALCVPIRFVLVMIVLVVYYCICLVCTAFSTPDRSKEEEEDSQEDCVRTEGWRRALIVSSGKFFSRSILFFVGFYWITVIDRDLQKDSARLTNMNSGERTSQEPGRPGVIVSNHVSYIDILYHMSSSFPSFVAKRSVAKLPLVGLISKCLGCVFAQRESKSPDVKGVAGIVADRIVSAHANSSAPMMLCFPEGTTTNGSYLLPFKSGAFIAGAPVLPVILKYPYRRFSPAWDSISGMRHIILLLCQFINRMEVINLPVYYPSQEEVNDPKLYADNVRRLMAREGCLTLSEIGLAEKRIYHDALNGNNCLPSVLHQKDD